MDRSRACRPGTRASCCVVQPAEVAIPLPLFANILQLIDTRDAVIVDVEATPTRITKEVAATETMLTGLSAFAERASSDTGLHPGRVSLDCRLTLSIYTQLCYRLRCVGGNIWEFPV